MYTDRKGETKGKEKTGQWGGEERSGWEESCKEGGRGGEKKADMEEKMTREGTGDIDQVME